jgi:hypothetical protein
LRLIVCLISVALFGRAGVIKGVVLEQARDGRWREAWSACNPCRDLATMPYPFKPEPAPVDLLNFQPCPTACI